MAEQLLSKLPLEETQAVGGTYYILHENGKAELGIGDRDFNGIAFKAHSNNHQLLPRSSNSTPEQVPPNLEEETIQSVIDRSVLYVSEYVTSISNGLFPLTSTIQGKSVATCGFKTICRIGAISENDADR